MYSRRTLSSRDTGVLNLLFDPEAQPWTSDAEDTVLSTDDPQFTSAQLEEIQTVERRAVQLAEGGALKEAENLISLTIRKYPIGRPSLWNNRAQVRRLSNNVS